MRVTMSRGHVVLFCATYSFFILVNSVINPLMPLLRDEMNFTSSEAASVAAFQTMGASLGKALFGGWAVDFCGARRSLVFSMFVSSILVYAYTLQTGVHGLAMCVFLMEFVSTSVYPAHVQFIRGWMPTSEHTRGFSLLGFSSRTADAASKLLYGALLHYLSWQHVALLSCAIGMGSCVVCWLKHADSPEEVNICAAVPSPADLSDVLSRILASDRFWLAVAAMGLQNTIKRTMEMTLGMYLVDSAPGLVDASSASQLCMPFALGLAVSVMACGALFERLCDADKITFLLLQNVLTIASLATLASISGAAMTLHSELAVRVGLCFLVAVGLGLPYYVPFGLFSVQFGGSNAGVVSAYMDVFSYLFAAVFISALNPVMAAAIDPFQAWATVWWLLTAVSVGMIVLNFMFLRMMADMTFQQAQHVRSKRA